ncbi:putative cell division protein ftsW [Leptolyngbya boryana NIES-2135]|jgi:cell division protein FtsW|uniref:Probable peptidoglycan glycosyltransferase FtsW n=1 Tax=Leptolyngbya boryana NIES-2135 TaxID=1973484 RepID=A0A1Z4JP01_LEPBY|nr:MULTISPECIES: FtsW/RodA/SpoVE family cell cycle protein [Leptolyngbya]BAY58387.1 putative cell division protein ftsW [Leptolyngbya boryana NIES-2135]MBD2368061.1 FtsW/RodA/SpoVE family cell cycle protein [Leptolyngbya sp. FACHB-161]MBD2374585.1 FtsW/RodA/SpoVE family cell cycle protein [Leptolyngbya sp. FACHB-238]MBD2399007.1 FtsW/RodA/SpoVE family cell cycle protein [Leptolyngbya sp. FACHB-239]MBD2405396.1 FtsW/RodA/SpoVE family cell cycle protein [Leptolyngbya sp. FACHB-402]
MNWRHFIPFFDTTAMDWAVTPRLLRWLTFVWLFVGLAVMFSASYPVGDAIGDGLYYFKRQLIAIALGMILFNVLIHAPLRYIQGVSSLGFISLLGGIFLTTVIGREVNGGQRWFEVGPFLIQPSELIKPFLVLQSARIFGQWERLTWRVRLTWIGLFGLMLIGILLQPNLSTTALCGMALWLVALAAGLPYLYLGGTAVGGLFLATLSISIREYQRRRVMSFLNPWSDPLQDGYQLIQSLLAIGSGGFAGTGFGLSQQKLFYLPIQYTDFIFAVFAEEFGLIGCFAFMVMLIAYATLALVVAKQARNAIHRLVAIGVMVIMVGQSLLNIGVATGALPTTGLPLPLFSYGGSSMISSLVCAALLIRVARESSEASVSPISENPKIVSFAEARTRRMKPRPSR